MNKINNMLGAFLMMLSLQSFGGNCAALSGNYTIGSGETADFATFGDAVNSLNNCGVAGPVTFVIEPGTYNERVNLSSIPGASAFNTVTFQGKSTNSETILSYGPTDATLVLNNVSFASFENLTIDHKVAVYGNCMRVDGKSNNLHFKGVVFNGVDVARTGANSATVYFTPNAPKANISFDDCEINNGSSGIYKGALSASVSDTKTSIAGTLFYNQYESGITLVNEDAPVISNNVISSLSTYTGYKALSLDNVSNTLIISNNIITAANGSIGIALNNCVAPKNDLGQINNNSVAVGGAGDTYGVYLSGNTDNQVLNYNRIKLTINSGESAHQAYYRNISSGYNINLLNEILYDLNTGGYTILGNTYKDVNNQLPAQGNPSLSVSANGIMIEKVMAIK